MCNTTSIDMHPICRVTAHPHLLVQTTRVQFLSARATFRIDLTSESFWMQTMLNSPFTSGHTNKCGWAISFNPFVYFIGKSSKHKVLPLYSRYTLNPLPEDHIALQCILPISDYVCLNHCPSMPIICKAQAIRGSCRFHKS